MRRFFGHVSVLVTKHIRELVHFHRAARQLAQQNQMARALLILVVADASAEQAPARLQVGRQQLARIARAIEYLRGQR